MAVLGRLSISSAQRLDLPDLLSIDSYAIGDWRYFVKGLVGNSKPYIFKGFDIIDPESVINKSDTCSIRVADSVVLYPESNSGPFFYGLPEGNPNALPLVPELRKNAVNYVYLTFSTFNTSVDTRAFWDPDKDNGIGGEFSQDVNTQSVLKVEINVSTGSFPSNTIPVAKITVGPQVITKIEDARDMMFRLGSGGINPNPLSSYNFRSAPSIDYRRIEPSSTMIDASNPNPFKGADKNIQSLKEWMDVVMTKLKELGGTTFWYEDVATLNMMTLFADSLGTTFKSKGNYEHSSSTPGNLTWTADITIKSLVSPQDIIIRAGSKQLDNEQVAYIPLIRNQLINDYDEPVSFKNGANYVNTIDGSLGRFANLAVGDWIKKASDGAHLSLRVEEFCGSINGGDPGVLPANARSVILSGNYQGIDSDAQARYTKGEYLASDIKVQYRNNADITDASGNFHWIATRSDTVQNVQTIQSFEKTGSVIKVDGERIRISCIGHQLEDGDRIRVISPVDHASSADYLIEKEDDDIFYIESTGTSTGINNLVFRYALLTTKERTNGYGFQIENSQHGFQTNDTVWVEGTSDFAGSHKVVKRSNTQVQFATDQEPTTETPATNAVVVRLAKLDVRSEKGISKVVQGETLGIGEGPSDNMQSFIGMNSLSESNPNYYVPESYNTLDGFANYNSSSVDSLTSRTSKLSAMMADKAQDKTIKYLTTANIAINTTSGSTQQLTFQFAGSTLTILQPGSIGNAVVTLPNAAPGISLLQNQSAYVTINRNAASTPTIQVANTDDLDIDENIIVIASRLTGTNVYLWDGSQVTNHATLVSQDNALVRVDFYDPSSAALPTGISVQMDDSALVAGDKVLFSNLAGGNNMIYQALGSGSNVTGWLGLYAFNGSQTPNDGDTVIVKRGAGFADQIGKFTGTKWVFNDYVRYFNGTDYWEQSNLISSTLTNNATDNVFTVNYANNENMIIDYSIFRNTTRETGTIHITTDGASVSVTTTGSTIGLSGVTFDGDIDGDNLRLRYTTTDSGNDATMKYMVRRWSNSPGGPGGLPNYTGLSGGYSLAELLQAIEDEADIRAAADQNLQNQINAIPSSLVETFTITPADISAGYLQLSALIDDIAIVWHNSGVILTNIQDYTITNDGVLSQLNFGPTLMPSGVNPFEVGEVITILYMPVNGLTGGIDKYTDVMFNISGSPASNSRHNIMIARAGSILSTSTKYGYADTPSAAGAEFTVLKNNTQIGIIDFAAGVNTPSFSFPSNVTLAPGDRLTIKAPAVPDASLKDLAITIPVVLM